MNKFIGIIGILIFLLIAYLISADKKKINWKLVLMGMVSQVIFALIILKLPIGQKFFQGISDAITRLLNYGAEGASFVFGDLVDTNKSGFIFAIQVLPTIVFFSALMSVLYHIGIMQIIVGALSKVICKLLGTSGAETLSAVANIFVGQNEAPLMIKPYIPSMTRSELFSVMVGGMATVSGGVMAGYVAMGVNAGHLLAASVMAAPASLVISKIMFPEVDVPETKDNVKVKTEKTASNVIEAAANGASEGVQLAFAVAGMLIAFVALIALLNAILGWFGSFVGMDYLSLNWIFGKLFAPVAYLMGVPTGDISMAGNLLGQKVVLNEFVAYSGLSTEIAANALAPKTIVILTYALCGFANFSSIAIQIGGIGGLAPSRKSDIAKLGLKAVLGGTLVTFITATLAGLLF
ncbi:concentrative nucleoside transporter, CNT family [Clostridium collagenovorans DSM 3089]|uniref:Nucleoside permease n=1 Tax=Clostridium collagenovorans DSM 3089 TaxID=1121306 RepID=A0A1M5SP14_9CLOT|nr:NupC/NupG family nucleoside CNT transporter [Clostridium collagenovorans]SHH39673.1 concentrative nucleoside transporter, CNT family [Clostridium collagenovorans DSM 3089]